MTKGAQIGIALGVTAVVGVILYMVFKPKTAVGANGQPVVYPSSSTQPGITTNSGVWTPPSQAQLQGVLDNRVAAVINGQNVTVAQLQANPEAVVVKGNGLDTVDVKASDVLRKASRF